MRRLPVRITLPVVGLTFRENDYPRNLQVLSDIMWHLGRLAEHPDDLDFFHHKRFRPIMDEALRHGRVPVALVRDYQNPASRHAVRVVVPLLEALFIGYVPENSCGNIAVPLSAELDDEIPWHSWVHRVRIDPNHPDQPGVDIVIVRGDADMRVKVVGGYRKPDPLTADMVHFFEGVSDYYQLNMAPDGHTPDNDWD